jgi:hypothetical protein
MDASSDDSEEEAEAKAIEEAEAKAIEEAKIASEKARKEQEINDQFNVSLRDPNPNYPYGDVREGSIRSFI